MPYTPDHTLSKRATKQGWNVFLWSSRSRKLLMGFRVDDDLPLTVASFYRWVKTVESFDIPKALPVTIRHVDIEQTNVLSYRQLPKGEPLETSSQDLVSPGDYALYDGAGAKYYYVFQRNPSFGLLSRGHRPPEFPMGEIDQCLTSIQEKFLQEVGCRCAMTDVSEGLTVTWIAHPIVALEGLHAGQLEEPHMTHIEPYMVASNTLMMTEEMVELFNENLLTIDVDDNYRIICFVKRDGLKNPLRTHLHPSVSQLVDDKFMRLHFVYSLRHNTCGGDVLKDYSETQLQEYLEELTDEDPDSQSDPRWNTPLGQAIHSWALTQRLRSRLTAAV